MNLKQKKTVRLRKPMGRNEFCISPNGKRYSSRRITPGIASEFMSKLSDLVSQSKTQVRVVLYCRESKDNGNLADQKEDALKQLETLGVEVISTFKEVENGSIFNFGRYQFDLAVDCALKENAVIVALSRDRFLRHRHSDNTNLGEQPTIGELCFFEGALRGVKAATIHDPDKSARGKQTKRGQTSKGKRGGRPYKLKPRGKERMAAYYPLALELHREGMSLRKIADTLNSRENNFPKVSHSTIRNWIIRNS